MTMWERGNGHYPLHWGFAFYAYSSEKYELSVFPDGSFTGTPEDAFAAAAMYLQ